MLLLAYGLGLYAIIEKIGSGGMGKLYGPWTPALIARSRSNSSLKAT